MVKPINDKIKAAATTILSAKYVTALTGAGVSVESGIPPFRGPGGIWTRHGEPPMDGYQRFLSDPKGSWESWLDPNGPRSLRASVIAAKPNPAHFALAELESLGIIKSLITQNIDGLHWDAGSRNVFEIHGNKDKLRCIECGARFPRSRFDLSRLPPRCPECGGLIKGDTVMFGEPIPMDVLGMCLSEAEKSDCMIVVGTSAVVQPAASLPLKVKSHEGVLIEINPYPSELSSICDLCLIGPAGEILPKLVEELKEMRKS